MKGQHIRNRQTVENLVVGTQTQYLYDAAGNRVARGTPQSWPASGSTCGAPGSAFSPTTYVLGLSGEQVSELDASGNWKHTNVFAEGRLLATYNTTETYFALSDWLGTKRVEYGSSSGCKSTFFSTAYGNGLSSPLANCPLDETEHHFTGKERDPESGLDDYGARYYNSNTGRFQSPDWANKAEPVPYAKLGNPQTLNLYAYVTNNPESAPDLDGHMMISLEEYQAGLWATHHPNQLEADEEVADADIEARKAAEQKEEAQQHQESTTATPQTRSGQSAQQQTAPAPAPAPKPTGNPSLDDAATKALQAQNPTSIKEDKEYATRAYKNPDGTYSIMPFNPGTQAGSPHGPISGLPAGTTNAALLHTHGGNDPGYDNEHFSPQDIKNAQREGVPSYLATPAGSIQRYDPGPNKVTILVPGSPQ